MSSLPSFSIKIIWCVNGRFLFIRTFIALLICYHTWLFLLIFLNIVISLSRILEYSLYIYIYIYVCVCVCVYTCAYVTCNCTCMCVDKDYVTMYGCVCRNIYIYIYMCVSMYAWTSVYVMYVWTYQCMHRMCTHVFGCIIDICMCTCYTEII